MKILSAIKSMSQPFPRDHEKGTGSCRWFPRDDQEDSVNIGITKQEAAERITNLVSQHITKKYSEASDTLRAMCSHPANGELLPKDYELQVNDLIVIAPGSFHEDDIYFSPHGMIVYVVDTSPMRFDIYEQTIDMRTEDSIQVGLALQTRYRNQHMHYAMTPSICNQRVTRYVEKHISLEHAFKMKLNGHHVYQGFINMVENAEKTRRAMSKDKHSQAPAYYGISNCNNVVYDTLKLAINIRNNE